MSDVRHTPEPWVAKGATVHAGGVRICQVSGPGGACMTAMGRHRETLLANAALIAAAPDMLKVCRLALQFIDDGSDGDNLDPAVIARQQIAAAIAKATTPKATQ